MAAAFPIASGDHAVGTQGLDLSGGEAQFGGQHRGRVLAEPRRPALGALGRLSDAELAFRFTWEVLAHLYLKRAWLLKTCFGSPDEHAASLAAALPGQASTARGACSAAEG